ncbi:hypothetical protein WA026_016032 [Henosepilachna vigintioctopunctata]|uniref:Uncharacterized protein n=1 Tax=Henosepilachna vigintioctopunctata TaxID=420089 RepID=A0AAW1UCL1_9CUCU
MYEDFAQGGHSYNHHGSVAYYSPNELTRICRHHPDEYAIEYAHGKRTDKDVSKHHRPHNKHKNNINEFDYESTTRKRKEKRKHKKEHLEEIPVTEQYGSVTHQHRERRKHRRSTKRGDDGFSGLNHQDIQRLMTDCKKDINKPSNFSIGYYEIKRSLEGQNVDQIPTRDVPSNDKIFRIPDDHHQRGDSLEINKYKEICQQFKTSPKADHLTDEGFYLYHPQVNGENHRHKTKRNKENSKKEKEFRTSDSVSVDRMIRRNIYNKNDYSKWNSEDSVIQHYGEHREIFAQQDDCATDLRNEKSKIKKLGNEDKNYKLTRKYMKRITKDRDTTDFRPRTRKIEYEMNKDGYNLRDTAEHYSDHKKNEERVKKRSSKKDQHKLIDLDDAGRGATKIQDNKTEFRKQKTKKEHTRIKSANVSQSLDRYDKSMVIDGNISTNNNFHNNLNPNFTLLNTKYTSETSLSTLHRKNDDFVHLFNTDSPVGETTRFDNNISKKKYCDMPPLYILETEKYLGVNSDIPRYHVDQIIYPVLSDDVSMQDRVELFQTEMKKDLSVHPRSNYSLCGYISSKIETNLDITKNDKDITFNDKLNTVDYYFEAATSTTPKNIDDDIKRHNRIESDETENTYGLMVKGVEPSKKINTCNTNQVNLSAEERINTLECKILSVVAITPDNSDDKMADLDARLMRTMSSGLLKKDIALQVRNPSSDKRLERLLKYYRVEPHPEMKNFSSSSERSSKDRRILKKLIIGKLADYLKKLQEDNTGEIIEFRTENPRVVKLVLPIDCLSLECSYDINFSKEELVSDTAKESLSDLYINYSDVDDVTSHDQQNHIHPNIQTDNIKNKNVKDTIVFEDNAENGSDLKNCSDFSNPSTSLRKQTQFQTEIVVNTRKFDSQPSHNEDLNLMPVNTTNLYQVNTNKEFFGLEYLNLKNSSTFIVSENDRSSANVNCLSNFQTSPRDSIYIKSLQMADNYSQQEVIENNPISSNDFCQKELFGLKKNDIPQIPNTKIETLITVRTVPEPRKCSEFFPSQNTSIEKDFSYKEENIPQVLKRTPESNNCCHVKQESHEYSKRATEFLLQQNSNDLGRSDQIMKKADYINWINQSIPNKRDSTKTNHDISSNTIASPHFEQGFENSSIKNDNCKKEKTFLQKDCNLTLGKMVNEKDITFDIVNDVDPPKGQNIVIDEDKHHTNALLPTQTTIMQTDAPERLLLGHVIYKTQQDTVSENLRNTQSKTKKICENVACPEAKIHKGTLEERNNINDKQVNTVNKISGEKELNQCLQKCLNWDIRDPSRTMMAEVADSDQNKISGLNKGTQKSCPKRSCIPVAKKNTSKSSSVQMRSSSLGRDNNTSLLLTKSYRIPLGQSSYERRKLYDTSIRKNGKRRSLSESSGTTNKNPLIYEVRYFNIHNNCVPSSINQSYERTEDDAAIDGGFSMRFNKVERKTNCDSLITASTKNSECNLKSIETVDDLELHQSKQSVPSKNYLQINQYEVDFSKEYSMPPRDFPITYIHEPRKTKVSAHKKNSYDTLDSKREKIKQRSGVSVKCSEKVHGRKKRLNQKRRNRDISNQNTEYDQLTSNVAESQKCQKLTKLSIEKVDNDELVLFFGKQNLFSTETEFSNSFDGKSLVSSSGNILENPDSIDENVYSSESTLINRQGSLSSTSIATIKGFGTGEVIEHSVIDSGYLTKEAEINYSRTTLEGGEKKGQNKLCELLKSKTSRWSQRDLFRLKLQLLFPDVYDDFELIEATENTELIEFYLDSGNDKLINAVETISRKKEMNVKSRSVISLPSTKTILKENVPFKPIGDVASDAFSKMNKGGFYNYQKFIAQNNDQYSSNVLSKIKFAQDYNNGRETTEDDYPRSETSSMKSSSLNSVKSTSSARRSIIELFKLRSCKNIVSSSEVIVTDADATEKEHNENISEEQFTNHFHQIMAMECQKFAKKVKNESLIRENTKQLEEFKEMPLHLILKNRNNPLKNRIDLESLPSLIETDDPHINTINEFSMPIPDNFCESSKSVNEVKIIESGENLRNKVQTKQGNKSLLGNHSKLNSTSPPEESVPESCISESSNLFTALDKSNSTSRTPISEVLSCGKIKQPEKEFFNNLLNFYDHKTEFATKLIRDNEFFVSLLEKIREDDSLNFIYQKDIQKKIKKGKKAGILTRLFRRKKKSNESLLTPPSMSKSLEFAKSLSADNNSVHKESCYSFFKDVEDFEIGGESEMKNQAVTEILKKLAFKAKSHLEPMAKATLSNQRINDRIKLAGFLNFLNMIEKGNISCMSNVNNNKSIVEEKVREHVAQLFDKVYRIANREVVQRNMILDDKKIDLLKFLVTKYHMGMDVHINILAIYIGRSLIQTRTQLEDAILSLMKLNTEEVNLEEFEKNCGIQRSMMPI